MELLEVVVGDISSSRRGLPHHARRDVGLEFTSSETDLHRKLSKETCLSRVAPDCWLFLSWHIGYSAVWKASCDKRHSLALPVRPSRRISSKRIRQEYYLSRSSRSLLSRYRLTETLRVQQPFHPSSPMGAWAILCLGIRCQPRMEELPHEVIIRPSRMMMKKSTKTDRSLWKRTEQVTERWCKAFVDFEEATAL